MQSLLNCHTCCAAMLPRCKGFCDSASCLVGWLVGCHAAWEVIPTFSSHTDPCLFEEILWRSYIVIHSLRFSIAMDKLPGHKRMFDSPIPDSYILNPEAKNPDFNNQTNQALNSLCYGSYHYILQS